MKNFFLQGRTLTLLVVIIPLLALFIYVGLRSGPLAPVAVTVVTVESQPITPALFGIGTVETRYTYKIGPTTAGRVKNLMVEVGESVKAGQILGEMEPVDLDERIRSQAAAYRRTQAVLRETKARHHYAKTQAHRYERLFTAHSVSEEVVTAKREELQIAEAALAAAREDIDRAQAEHDGLQMQKNNLRLVAPTDGIVAKRDADPGTTVVAGQSVVEVIDPKSLWVNVRFDQISASGLTAGLPAHVTLRSRNGQVLSANVLRVEPIADAVTEELLAKVVFEVTPEPLPSVGELAEITVDLSALPASPVIPNAAIQRADGQIGVWQIVADEMRFSPIKLGAADLEGRVQVREGLESGDSIIVYSEKALTLHSRIHIVDKIPGVSHD